MILLKAVKTLFIRCFYLRISGKPIRPETFIVKENKNNQKPSFENLFCVNEPLFADVIKLGRYDSPIKSAKMCLGWKKKIRNP